MSEVAGDAPGKKWDQLTFDEKCRRGYDKAVSGAWAATIAGTLHGMFELPFVVPLEAAITQTQLNAKGFIFNFGDLLKKRALYRSFSATASGLVPKCWVHYAFINFWLAVLVETADMRKA
eukprot:255045_1